MASRLIARVEQTEEFLAYTRDGDTEATVEIEIHGSDMEVAIGQHSFGRAARLLLAAEREEMQATLTQLGEALGEGLENDGQTAGVLMQDGTTAPEAHWKLNKLKLQVQGTIIAGVVHVQLQTPEATDGQVLRGCVARLLRLLDSTLRLKYERLMLELETMKAGS